MGGGNEGDLEMRCYSQSWHVVGGVFQASNGNKL